MLADVIGLSTHLWSVFLLVGAVIAELYLLKLPPSVDAVRLIARVDLVYGIAAVLTLVTGVGGAFHAKGLPYYLHNAAFHAAITFFVLAGLLSITPTLRFRRWKRAAAGGSLPAVAEWNAQKKWVHLQTALIAAIAFCMAAMSIGYGSFPAQ